MIEELKINQCLECARIMVGSLEEIMRKKCEKSGLGRKQVPVGWERSSRGWASWFPV